MKVAAVTLLGAREAKACSVEGGLAGLPRQFESGPCSPGKNAYDSVKASPERISQRISKFDVPTLLLHGESIALENAWTLRWLPLHRHGTTCRTEHIAYSTAPCRKRR